MWVGCGLGVGWVWVWVYMWMWVWVWRVWVWRVWVWRVWWVCRGVNVGMHVWRECVCVGVVVVLAVHS